MLAGGLGAVSFGIGEPVFWLIVGVVVLLFAGGAWKLWKIVVAALAG